jgi:hypothetical protein
VTWQAPAKTMGALPIRVRAYLVLALVAVAAAVLGTWPVAAHLRDHLVDGGRLIDPEHGGRGFWAGNIGADVFTTAWVVNWDLNALWTQPFDLFDANIFWPTRLALARSEHMFATALLAAPGRLWGGPVAAHQTALLACVALNVFAAGWVLFRWTGSLVAGVAAGLLFALSPFHQENFEHLQNLGTAYLPISLFALERFGATGAPRWVALGGVALLLQLLSGQYLAYFALVAWGVGGAIVLPFGRPGGSRRDVVRDALLLGAATGLVAAAALPFALPYLRLLQGGELPPATPARQMWLSSVPTLLSYLDGRGAGMPMPLSAATWLLAVAGAAALAGAGRTGLLRLAMIAAVGLVGALVSLGPPPYGTWVHPAIAAVVPGFGTMREPWRASLIPSLAAALLAGFGAAELSRRFAWKGAAVAMALVAIALARSWHAPLPLRAVALGRDLPRAYEFLARCGGGDPLLELPAFLPLQSLRDAPRTLYSIVHGLPLLNGRSGYPPRDYQERMRLAVELPETHAWEELRKWTGVRWILIHCDEAPPRWNFVTLCRGRGFGPRTPAHRFGNTVLYDLGPVPSPPRPLPWRAPPPSTCPPPGKGSPTERMGDRRRASAPR